MSGDSSSGRDFGRRVEALDVTLFDQIGAPGWRRDARSLLAVHAAARELHETFAYLEIGSYLGASLQLYVADSRCSSVMSIDPRPETAPDDRWDSAYFAENSTEHMLERLRTVPGARLEKVRTYELDASDVGAEDLPVAPDVCFIDGEHTYRAALGDARFCARVAEDGGVIVFHDRAVVARAIADFVAELRHAGRQLYAYALPSALFVVELGPGRFFATEPVKRAAGRSRSLWAAANHVDPARHVRLLLGAESGARRLLPAWLKRPLAAVADRRADASGVHAAPAGAIADRSDAPRR